ERKGGLGPETNVPQDGRHFLAPGRALHAVSELIPERPYETIDHGQRGPGPIFRLMLNQGVKGILTGCFVTLFQGVDVVAQLAYSKHSATHCWPGQHVEPIVSQRRVEKSGERAHRGRHWPDAALLYANHAKKP